MFPYTAQALGEAYRVIPRLPGRTGAKEASKDRMERAMQGRWDIRETEPGIFSVRNLENNHVYTVTCHVDGDVATWTCSCPDHGHRRQMCKHILAVFFRSGLVVADVDLDPDSGEPRRSRIVPISLFGKNGQNGNGQPQIQTNGQTQTTKERSDMQNNGHTPRWMREYPVDDGIAPLYPFVQWVNDGSMLEPQQPTGGFASPVDQVQIGMYAYLHHRDGSVTEVTFTPALRVAVLRTRFSWTKDGALLPSYVPGARGKFQALCLVDVGQIIGPVILTFTGLAGARFNSEYLRFAREVAKQTQRRAPAYAFFMNVQAGKVEMVGKGQKKSPITPPAWDGDLDLDRDFVGDEALDSLNWDEIKRWAEAWRKPRPNGDSVITEEEEFDEDSYEDSFSYEEETRPAAPAQPQRPAAPAQPQRPAAPAQPARPAAPAQPQRPAAPAQPQRPAAPAQPQRPTAPAQPQRPAAPAQPQRPAAPAQPQRPAAPAQPSRPTYQDYQEEDIPF